MNNFNIRANYLYNSGFSVETENYFLIFDYFKDTVDSDVKNRTTGAISEEDLQTSKKLIVFSSHSHADHFNPVILEWEGIRPDIKYVLSSDIQPNSNSKNINIMNPYETLTLQGVEIKSFGSTDLGISFLVKADGVNIFHSGDLNWWYWWDDTKEEIAEGERLFKEEISKIKGNQIDIAFFPVDPRLEHNYCAGGEYFIKELSPKVFIPMHFGEDYSTTDKFKEKMADSDVDVKTINRRGEEFNL
jgi:L-ascorbate metabolism protein UlaG (beta-lactamase superfamily)